MSETTKNSDKYVDAFTDNFVNTDDFPAPIEDEKLGDRLKPVQSLLETVQTALSVSLGLLSLIILTGFVIVNSYLARKTDVHGYSLTNGQYIAAGTLYLMIVVVSVVALGAVFRVLPFTNRFYFQPPAIAVRIEQLERQIREARLRYKKLTSKRTLSIDNTKPTRRGELQQMLTLQQDIYSAQATLSVFKKTAKRTMRNRQLITYSLGVFLLLVVGIGYANVIYPVVPRALGGGYPATIVLSLKPEYPPYSLMLTADSSNPIYTRELLLLAELNDGLLVQDQVTGNVVAIKNEAIVAIVDDGFVPVPSPTPTS